MVVFFKLDNDDDIDNDDDGKAVVNDLNSDTDKL